MAHFWNSPWNPYSGSALWPRSNGECWDPVLRDRKRLNQGVGRTAWQQWYAGQRRHNAVVILHKQFTIKYFCVLLGIFSLFQQHRPQNKYVRCEPSFLSSVYKMVKILHAAVGSHYITGRVCKGESTVDRLIKLNQTRPGSICHRKGNQNQV